MEEYLVQSKLSLDMNNNEYYGCVTAEGQLTPVDLIPSLYKMEVITTLVQYHGEDQRRQGTEAKV